MVIGHSPASGVGPAPQGAEPSAKSQAEPLVPNAEWNLRFDAPVGARLLSYGRSITIFGPAGEPALWWDLDNRRWLTDEEVPWGRGNPDRTFGLSSHAPCRTFKAFKRHLRRHAEKLSGREVVFVNRFKGNDVWAMPAQTTEARRAATGNTDAVHEGAGPQDIAQSGEPA